MRLLSNEDMSLKSDATLMGSSWHIKLKGLFSFLCVIVVLELAFTR